MTGREFVEFDHRDLLNRHDASGSLRQRGDRLVLQVVLLDQIWGQGVLLIEETGCCILRLSVARSDLRAKAPEQVACPSGADGKRKADPAEQGPPYAEGAYRACRHRPSRRGRLAAGGWRATRCAATQLGCSTGRTHARHCVLEMLRGLANRIFCQSRELAMRRARRHCRLTCTS